MIKANTNFILTNFDTHFLSRSSCISLVKKYVYYLFTPYISEFSTFHITQSRYRYRGGVPLQNRTYLG